MHCVKKEVKTTSASFSKTSTDKKFLSFSEDPNEVFSRVLHLTDVLWLKETVIVTYRGLMLAVTFKLFIAVLLDWFAFLSNKIVLV